VVDPNHESEETNQHCRKDHRRVTEKTFTSKRRNDFRENTECWQDQDINFRVTKDPEEMFPNDDVPARCRVKEVSTEESLERQEE